MKTNPNFCQSLFSLFLLGAVTFACLGLSTVFLRQKIASHALHLRVLEQESQEMDLRTLSLASHIAQLETPLHLQFQSRGRFRTPSADQIIRVRNWPYASHMAPPDREPGTLAMSLNRSQGKVL